MTVFEQEMREKLGEAVSFDAQILRSYDHDLGEMPGPLMLMVKHVPQAVVAARNVSDVSQTLLLAAKYGIPVTARAQASSGYGGAIPSKGGIVLDLSGMNRVLAIDANSGVVDVEPGVIWQDLSRHLNKVGLDNRVCPTSAPSSTVGGWFAMGGVGIGSFAYGSFLESVLSIDVVGLDGQVSTHSGADVTPFYQSCGTLGIVTRLRLACRPADILRPAAVWLPDAAKVSDFLTQLEKRITAYSVSIVSDGYCSMRAAADGHKPVIDSGFLVSLAIPEKSDNPSELAGIARSCSGQVLEKDLAEKEWEERYYPMRIKKVGPSMLVGEFYLPFAEFGPCFEKIRSALPIDVIGLEAFAVKGKQLAILIYIRDHSGQLLYPLRMSKAMIPLQVARHYGGSMYAAGMWFAADRKELLGEERYELVQRLKKQLDPKDLLNPDKSDGPGVPFLPFLNLSRLILFGTSLMSPFSARIPYKRTHA